MIVSSSAAGHWSTRRRAFTLVELMVVIAVMVILMAIALPAIKSLTSNNNQKQAVNLLTSLLANARASAIQSHTWAGLVVYEDSTISLDQSAAQVVISSAKNPLQPTITSFVQAPRTMPQMLPPGIKIATLDDAGATAFRTEASVAGGAKCRIILFDENGQMVLRSGLARDASVVYAGAIGPSPGGWNLNAAPGSESNGVSSPGFVVYNSNDLTAAVNNGTVNAGNLPTWLQSHGDLIIVNAYTGNVIR